MKAIKKITKSLTTGALLAALAVNFNACNTESPMNASSPSGSEKVLQTINGPVQVLSLGASGSTLQKITSVTEFIRANEGGLVVLRHNNPRNGMVAEMSLRILPKTLDGDKEITMTLDDEDFVGNMDVVFGAHGTVFSKPAILNVYANGLDFSGVNVEALQIYYYEPTTDTWEAMQADFIGADAARGEIKIINAQIPHFSRYAVAWSN